MRIDESIKQTKARRYIAAAFCLWVSIILLVALNSAIENDEAVHNASMFWLLLLGFPLAIASFGYSISLMSSRLRKATITMLLITIAIFCVRAYEAGSDDEPAYKQGTISERLIDKYKEEDQRSP